MIDVIETIFAVLIYLGFLFFLLKLGEAFWKALVELLADVYEEVKKRRKADE
ncbi:hypothetical protein [Thermococcus sp. 2319x1]|uniref:hypothetical protein n=1 Tax=Thermococcus sp. 2319x1 TaxID=1674923 RepID=UPI0015834A84|nr:hypothetical protein [Thermococcus sp. 2319x1]